MTRAGSGVLVAAILALSQACNDGSGPSGSIVTMLTGDNQTAPVASAVATPPAVLVLDANGRPIPGATVTFAVGVGHGSLAGGAATTDTNGVATVGHWTLGTTTGTNTLTATMSGVPAITFTATGTTGPADRMTKQAGDNQTGTAGSLVPLSPAVMVTDAFGNPVSGVTVVFSVSLGAGSATGVTATTDAQGIAMVGGWILGTTVGANALTAAASGLPDVTFEARSSAGQTTGVTKHAGDGQMASIGVAVATPPAVSVTDAFGNAVRGAVVIFAVTSGGGSVVGAIAMTDSSGTATVGGWTLGANAGANTLSAAVPGLPAATFTATATDPCVSATVYAIGSSVTGALAGGDCRIPSEYRDLYAATAPSTVSVRFDLSSSAFDADLNLFDGNGAPVAYGVLPCDHNLCGPTASLRILLGAGTWIASAGGHGYDYYHAPASPVGGYLLSSRVVPEDVAGCELVYITRGVTTSQRIDNTDCAATFRSASFFSDQFAIQLTAGQTYTISMSSADFDAYLELRSDSAVVASNDDVGVTSNSSITFTPLASGLYVINATTHLGDKTGTYTIVIQ